MAHDVPRSLGRRLHTLSGAVVLAAFLVGHLLTNASALGGEALYDRVAGAIERWRLVGVLEIVFIAVPLIFHIGYGLVLLRRPPPDREIDRYVDRRLWIVQRMSAMFVAAFVLGHLLELRLQRLLFGLSKDALYTTLTAHLSWTWGGIPWIALLYLLGILATLFHLSNGLLAVTRGRRRGVVLAAAGILFLIGGSTVIGLATGTRLLPGPSANTAPCGSLAVPSTRP